MDHHFVVDVRLKDADSSVQIHAGPVFQVDFRDQDIAAHLEKPGSWNRIEAVIEDGKHWLKINKHRVASQASDRRPSGQLILKPTGPVDFANIYATSK